MEYRKRSLTYTLMKEAGPAAQGRAGVCATSLPGGPFREIPLRLGEISLEGAVELAQEHDIYAYDAYILECARRYRTPLLSLDGPQRMIAETLGIEVLEV